jgi:cyclophilin family peptidyl-prolyl cis-trans isomerase
VARVVGQEGEALARRAQGSDRLGGSRHRPVADPQAAVEVEQDVVVGRERWGGRHRGSLSSAVMPRLLRTLAALLACLLLAGAAACGGDDGGTAATPTPEDTGGEQGSGCAAAEQPRPKTVDVPKPRGRLQAGTTYVATVTTSCGAFEITLAARRAPRTGAAFKALADAEVYDGTTFHRIVPGFVIQGGDPAGDGTGGPDWTVVEPPPSSLAYTRGVVAMAKTGADPPGASGSQFFVVTGEDAELPPDYALLGEVTGGQEVVDRIGVVPVDTMQRPIEPVVIESVRVEQS